MGAGADWAAGWYRTQGTVPREGRISMRVVSEEVDFRVCLTREEMRDVV